MLETLHKLTPGSFPALDRRALQTLQVNLGYLCNQQCQHCHVDAGPRRTENMDAPTIDLVIEKLAALAVDVLDLTGGAPELNPGFRRLVLAARKAGVRVIDRCNLTVLFEPGHDDLADFLAASEVEIVASLPCYLEENVDRQRGRGVFDDSIRALLKLNALGYGQPGSGRVLNLVYNPQGAVLPPPQAGLEADYRKQLSERYGIRFNQLLALANLPIKRFGSMLLSRGEFDSYLSLLKSAHVDSNLDQVMCRSLLSVDWQGYVYDCDFNQMLGLGIHAEDGGRQHLRDVHRDQLTGRPIRVADHCFGCTAGQGSSCGGALSDDAA